ncbi:hypothetical protein [Pseudomonas sp. GM17]|uniref:hypothetical protein n=1 Tax=Pseudomonas sp. GM17 TaxID=1144323 RepID=UPI0012F6F5DC|nr:hypothetical protein [Pseudomonas sp. GM17]WIE52604.1 hypothetical protein PMI20_013675 [Pseudomonas sp. GM17]
MKPSKKTLKDSLLFSDAYLSGSSSSLHKDFDPKYILNLDDLYVQAFVIIDRHEIVGLQNKDNDLETKLFRSHFEFGARWLSDVEEDENAVSLADSANEEDKRIVRATIEANFIVEYVMLQDFDEKTLIKYAHDEISIEIWPFWREFLTSQVSRMHLTGVKMPVRKKVST